MSAPSFYWHDYETFGTDPQRDRVCQFAGIRTDLDFNVLEEPVSFFCKPTADYLPQPEACLITGITPQFAAEHGVCEAAFAAKIHDLLAKPGSCGVGYNSLRFDDEVTRNLLYRNFYDPYAREWQQGNSRWDLIDVVRAASALRPEGINWPVDEQGVNIFKLEALTQANGIAHEAAHEALSDVYATIAMARLIKQQQPKLFGFLWQNRSKSAVNDLLQVGSNQMLVHVSGRFPARKHCMAIVLPLCTHPSNSNEVVVYDLTVDPTPLLELPASEIQRRVFSANADLAEGETRIPLKTVHINKCPVLAPVSVIKQADAIRLNLDLDLCERHRQILTADKGVLSKMAEVFNRQYPEAITDPDLMIYSGGFFKPKDKAIMETIRTLNPQQLAELKPKFEDGRLAEMLFRYRARNYPDSLNSEEQQRWRMFCQKRLSQPQSGLLTLADFQEKLRQLHAQHGKDHLILKQLADYARILSSLTAIHL